MKVADSDDAADEEPPAPRGVQRPAMPVRLGWGDGEGMARRRVDGHVTMASTKGCRCAGSR